jgi:hypothetical protein
LGHSEQTHALQWRKSVFFWERLLYFFREKINSRNDSFKFLIILLKKTLRYIFNHVDVTCNLIMLPIGNYFVVN